jgi:hypothetical protein
MVLRIPKTLGMRTALALAIGLSSSVAVIGAVPPPDIEVQRLSHRIYGAGYNAGAVPANGDGTQKTFTNTYANESRAPISVCSAVFQPWVLRSNGYAEISAAYSVAGNIEYPSGTVVGSYTVEVTPGQATASAAVELLTPIPPGASFRVTGAATVPAGQTYVIQSLGFAGLRTHALASELVKVAIGSFGDSLNTNNGGAFYNAAAGRCPVYVNSIIGTTAKTYGANGAAFFQKQMDLCKLLGLTDVTANFGTNDVVGSVTLEELQGYVLALRDAAHERGLKFNYCTMTPRVSGASASVPISSLTSAGKVLTAVVPDASRFKVGHPARCVGGSPAEYVGSFMVTSIDAATNTVTMLFPGSDTPAATGAPTLGPWKPTYFADWQTPINATFAPGPNSNRGKFNAWLRGGAVDGFIDWADASEPFRDSGRFLVCGETDLLPAPRLVTVSKVTSTSRFTCNYDGGNSTMANGFVQPATGANQGVTKNASGNTGGDITVTSAWVEPQALNDQYYVVPGTSYVSDDGLHHRVAGGNKGGQKLLDIACADWIDRKAGKAA